MNSQSHIANTNFDLWSVRILYHLSHQRKNCAFAHFQNKFEKCRLFACFFFSRPSATRISLASWSCLTFEESLCVGTALLLIFKTSLKSVAFSLVFSFHDQAQLAFHWRVGRVLLSKKVFVLELRLLFILKTSFKISFVACFFFYAIKRNSY